MDSINVRRSVICGGLLCGGVLLIVYSAGAAQVPGLQTRVLIVTGMATAFCAVWSMVSKRWGWLRHAGTLLLIYFFIKKLTDFIPISR